MTTRRGMRFSAFEGIVLLGRRLGDDFREDLDLERLDLLDFELCVLGQLFGTYRRGVDWLKINNPWFYGFIHHPTVKVCYCDQLTEVWRELLVPRGEGAEG